MAYQDFRDGRITFNSNVVDVPCETYYKIFGDLKAGPPAIILHGGPGSGHEYCLPFSRLWPLYKIPVIFYDQIGCAASTHLRHLKDDESVWKTDLFISELETLLDHFNLRSAESPGYYVLGHSWGGKFGSEFACRRPQGMRRLVLASASASSQLFVEGARKLAEQQLAPEHGRAIKNAIEADDFTDPAFLAATDAFRRTFLCRAPADAFPPPLLAIDNAHQKEDPTTRQSLNGLSSFVHSGSMKDWNIIPSLANINVPTLVYNGEHDTTHYEPTAPFFEKIPRVRWRTIPGASHMPHLDSEALTEETIKLVGDFLTQR